MSVFIKDPAGNSEGSREYRPTSALTKSIISAYILIPYHFHWLQVEAWDL